MNGQKIFIINWFLIFFLKSAEAQILPGSLPHKANKPTSTNKKTAEKKKPDIKSRELMLKITTNADCNLKIDGDDNGFLKANEFKKVYLAVGTFLIRAISTSNNADVFEDTYEVKEVNKEKVYKIDLKAIIAKRMDEEKATRQKIIADQQRNIEDKEATRLREQQLREQAKQKKREEDAEAEYQRGLERAKELEKQRR